MRTRAQRGRLGTAQAVEGVVEVKAASEGRSDRVIPLLSQAILQAQAYSRVMNKVRPLAVVMVGDVSGVGPGSRPDEE